MLIANVLRLVLVVCLLALSVRPDAWAQTQPPTFTAIILNAPDGHNFGAPVAFVGDFNGDHIPDLAVAELTGGRIYLFSGLDGSRIPHTFDTGCGGLFVGGGGGEAIFMAGIQVQDGNGGPVPGIVAACSGRAYLFTDSGDQPRWTSGPLDGFGVAVVPDKDGDGVSDVLVGGTLGQVSC